MSNATRGRSSGRPRSQPSGLAVIVPDLQANKDIKIVHEHTTKTKTM